MSLLTELTQEYKLALEQLQNAFSTQEVENAIDRISDVALKARAEETISQER